MLIVDVRHARETGSKRGGFCDIRLEPQPRQEHRLPRIAGVRYLARRERCPVDGLVVGGPGELRLRVRREAAPRLAVLRRRKDIEVRLAVGVVVRHEQRVVRRVQRPDDQEQILLLDAVLGPHVLQNGVGVRLEPFLRCVEVLDVPIRRRLRAQICTLVSRAQRIAVAAVDGPAHGQIARRRLGFEREEAGDGIQPSLRSGPLVLALVSGRDSPISVDGGQVHVRMLAFVGIETVQQRHEGSTGLGQIADGPHSDRRGRPQRECHCESELCTKRGARVTYMKDGTRA
ncbi:unnamed protein product, partial [Mycena citricolor]